MTCQSQATLNTALTYQHSIGSSDISDVEIPALPFVLAEYPAFTFNTPVGLCTDQFQRTWVADTGNNRIVIVSDDLTTVLGIYGTPGNGTSQFNMPFRLLHHPDKPWVYVSDLANRRIHILQYDRALTIKTISIFGNTGPLQEQLQGPNGLVFCEGKLCVADEFFVNSEGGGRVAIFSDTGQYIDDIQHITGASDPGLLWPQGISCDEQGYLYIANTGFYSVVRCDISGKGIPFSSSGTPEIEGLDLSRDVAVINNTIYIPGGSANHINRYTLEGEMLPSLAEFFAPIQIIPYPKSKQHILVSEPILASISLYQLENNFIAKEVANVDGLSVALPEYSIGHPRNNPDQFYFVTSVVAETIRLEHAQTTSESSLLAMNTLPTLPANFNPLNPYDWMSESYNMWMKSWETAMDATFKFWFPNGARPKNKRQDAWLLDSANRQISRSALSENATLDSDESLFPLLPGALGIDAFHPCVEIPGQVAPGTALFLVTNYLSGIVSVLQYNPYIDDLVHFNFFGGYGSAPWQLKNPQGIAVNDTTGDIYIADSGNHRISHWRISAAGIIGFIDTYGSLGQGDGEFFGPSDVSIDNQGNLYVADQTNNRIQVLDSNGHYLYQFGQQGYGKNNANFLLPTSLMVNGEQLFVNDLVNRSLKVFSLQGDFITAFSGLGATPGTGQLWMPYLMHSSPQQLIVPDCATNQAHLYSYTKHDHTEHGNTPTKTQTTIAILEAATQKHFKKIKGLHVQDIDASDEQRNHDISELFNQVIFGSKKEAAGAMKSLQSTHSALHKKQRPPIMP